MANGNGNLDYPQWLKIVLNVIDRVGFPIVAFGLMWWMSTQSIDKVNCTLEKISAMLIQWETSTTDFRSRALNTLDDLKGNQKIIINDISRLHEKVSCYGRTP
jgi:hypothetical protein